jgi:hypothetical protein
MADVFISYSRKDIDFARRLVEALKNAGQEAWIDWQGIPYSADWWREICAGIDSADTFLFIISPHSLASRVCNLELDFARQNAKRIVPLMHAQVEGDDHQLLPEILEKRDEDWSAIASDNWAALKKLNWLFFRVGDDFDTGFASLVETAQQDPQHVRQHTRLLVRAKEWAANQHKAAYALRADDLREAENWLRASTGKNPASTTLHREYIEASRIVQTDEDKRRRNLNQARFGLVLAIVLVIILAMVFLNMRDEQQATADVLATRIQVVNDQAATLNAP